MHRYYQDNQFRLATAQDFLAELNAYPDAGWVLQQYLKNPPVFSASTFEESAVPQLTFKYPAKPCAMPQ
jgi:hypothetical protein